MDAYGPGGTGIDGEAVGAAMRLARRRLGLSQRALADALSWHRTKVGRWENGTVPEGFEEVVAVLRNLGFELVMTDPYAGQWTAWDDPAEHILDRANRRFPAHLQLCEENALSTWNWTRHGGEPSPHAARTSFRRRTQVEALAEVTEWRGRGRGGGAPAEGAKHEDQSPPGSGTF